VASEFASFLERAMGLIAREKAAVYRRVCQHLAEARIRLVVDGDVVAPRFDARGFALGEPCEDPEIALESDRATILAVLDGELTLDEAVWGERIALRGALDDLALFLEALVLVVGGAVRCPSFPELLVDYRGAGEPKLLPHPPSTGGDPWRT